MKTRKSISYAYPSSPHAERLGCGKTGCHYVAVSVFRDGASWSPNEPLPNAEGFQNPTDPDLLASYMEADGEPCPYFLRHGNAHTLRALRNDYPVSSRPASRKSAAQRLASQI